MGKNVLTLEGYLAKDPEIRYAPSGSPIAKFSIPHGHGKWNPDTKRWALTTWFECVAFGDVAQNIGNSWKKGVQVCVVGKIFQDRPWTDKEGKERRDWKVYVDEAHICMKPNTAERTAPPADDPDIPF